MLSVEQETIVRNVNFVASNCDYNHGAVIRI